MYWSIRSTYDQNKPVLSLHHPYTIPRSHPQFAIPQSLLFHVQLWNSHPARRHLTPALTIYGNCPKNTDLGSHTAIFANSAHKDQHSHERLSERQTGVFNLWAFTDGLITRQCQDFSNYLTSKTKYSDWETSTLRHILEYLTRFKQLSNFRFFSTKFF